MTDVARKEFDVEAAREWCAKHDTGGHFPQLWIDTVVAACDEIDRLRSLLLRAEEERDEALDQADGMARAPYGEFKKAIARAEAAEEERGRLMAVVDAARTQKREAYGMPLTDATMDAALAALDATAGA